jgi:hypothetical protein
MICDVTASLRRLVVDVISSICDQEPWQYDIGLDESNPNSLTSLFGHSKESQRAKFVRTGLVKNNTAEQPVCQPIL